MTWPARPISRDGSAPGYRLSSPMKTGDTFLPRAPNRIKNAKEFTGIFLPEHVSPCIE